MTILFLLSKLTICITESTNVKQLRQTYSIKRQQVSMNMTVKFVFNCQTVTLQLGYFTKTLYINKTQTKQRLSNLGEQFQQ